MFKQFKLILNIVGVVFIILSIVILFLNSVNVDIRWYGAKQIYDNGRASQTKVFVDSKTYKASGFDMAFGNDSFKASFFNELLIILLMIVIILIVLRIIFSFLPKLQSPAVIIGLIVGWSLLVLGVIIWFGPLFSNISNSVENFINDLDSKDYEILVSKNLTVASFFSGVFAILGGFSILISVHLRYD